jgi:hypothetical protein
MNESYSYDLTILVIPAQILDSRQRNGTVFAHVEQGGNCAQTGSNYAVGHWPWNGIRSS